jgi:hypothetical protein
MMFQLFLGSVLIIVSIIISVIMIGIAIQVLLYFAGRLSRGNHLAESILALGATTTWFVFVVTVNVWIWAFAFMALGVFSELEEALYFALVSFTTLGFGDVILPQEWRLLSGFVATAGFMLFGLGTAFLFEIMQRYYNQRQDRTKKR